MNGNKLRYVRKQKDYTIEHLANLTGFTTSYISQIERNKIEPSLTALQKICEVLNVSMYYFLEEQNQKCSVTRKPERNKVVTQNNSSYEFISPMGHDKGFVPKIYIYEVDIRPNVWESEKAHNHICHKCIVVKKGALLVEFQDHNEILNEGDSIYICEHIEHRLYNPTDEDAQIMVVLSDLDLS